MKLMHVTECGIVSPRCESGDEITRAELSFLAALTYRRNKLLRIPTDVTSF